MDFLLVAFVLAALNFHQVTSISLDKILDDSWRNFKEVHQKEYKSYKEEEFRRAVWMNNVLEIADHNLLFYQTDLQYKLAMNSFGDLLHQEFITAKTGTHKRKFKFKSSAQIHSSLSATSNLAKDLPISIDWRKLGAVTPIKSQGDCGACWAFSATGALEGQHFRKTGKLISMSEQNLIDCVVDGGADGCSGGVMEAAYLYIRNNGGIDSEESYPYEEIDGPCRYNASNRVATDTGFRDLPEGDEEIMKEIVAFVGPVSAGIDSTRKSFQFYSRGVYKDPACSPENMNHGILVVGYGVTKDDEEYWLIKNSWGTEWGEEGYFRLARNKNNTCGITTEASIPIVD